MKIRDVKNAVMDKFCHTASHLSYYLYDEVRFIYLVEDSKMQGPGKSADDTTILLLRLANTQELQSLIDHQVENLSGLARSIA